MNRSYVVLLASLMQAPPLRAAPSDYVFLPSVSYGEREFDFKAGSARNPDEPRQSAGSLGFGYGVTQRWFTEIYGKYDRLQGEGLHFCAWEWENKFQVTEAGEYPSGRRIEAKDTKCASVPCCRRNSGDSSSTLTS